MSRARAAMPLISITILSAFLAVVALNGVALSGDGDSDGETRSGSHVQDGDYVKVLSTAFAVSRTADSLATTGAVASNVKMTRESVLASKVSIDNYKAELRGQTESLEGRGYDDRVSRVSEHVDSLIANVDEIEQGRPNLLRAMLAGAQNLQKLGTTTPQELIPAISDSLDDQFYYMVTGRSDSRNGDTTAAEALTLEEFLRYYHLANLRGSTGSSQYSLLIASRLADPTLVTRLEESFDSSAHSMSKSIEYLSENGGPELHPRVIPLSVELVNAGAGQDNYFDALKARLEMVESERDLIAANKRILDDLQAELDALVRDVERDYAAA